MQNRMKKVIMMLGMHRSGTSLVSQICNKLGVYLGSPEELPPPQNDNSDGHFENIRFISTDDRILRFYEQEWFTLSPADIDLNNLYIISQKEKVKKILLELLSHSDVVGIKEPRISVLLPFWEAVLKELNIEVHYIWIYRNPMEVAESLKKRNGYTKEHGLTLWFYYNLSILQFLNGKSYMKINYNDLFSKDKALDELASLLDIQNPFEKLEGVIKSQYRHSVFCYEQIPNLLGGLVADMYVALLKNIENNINIEQWSMEYRKHIQKLKKKYISVESEEDKTVLKDKNIVIYGAGKKGENILKMLRTLDVEPLFFCDRDTNKQGRYIGGIKVLSLDELESESRKGIVFLVAIKNEKDRKEMEQTLICINNCTLLPCMLLESFCEKKYKNKNIDNTL